jgi:Ser/Thr protein kinase RdoA (MazF antagonist)
MVVLTCYNFRMLSIPEFLDANYPCGPFHIETAYITSGQRRAYRVRGAKGQYVCKLTDPGRAESVVRADVGTPEYLSEQGFPAPRLAEALNGDLYLSYDDRFLYLYEHIPGEHPRPKAGFYKRLGRLLAHLHNLPPDARVPESDYRPERILAEVRQALLACDLFIGDPTDLTPAEKQAIVPELVDIIDRFPNFDRLPRGIIHSDPYLVNLVETPGGDLYLIDWEDGGVSYPLLDVGYVLAYMVTFTAQDRGLWGVPGPEAGPDYHPNFGKEFLDAYQAIRPLTGEELRLLPDAIRLSFIEYIPNWGTTELILDNYRRMKMVV